MDFLVNIISPKFDVAREGPVFEGREGKVRLAALTVHIKPRLSANGRVPFLRVYRSRGISSPGGIGFLQDRCVETLRFRAVATFSIVPIPPLVGLQ